VLAAAKTNFDKQTKHGSTLSGITRAQESEKQWSKLCESFLPVAVKGSFWRYSRGLLAEDPEQGIKLHLSATILSANVLLQKVGGFLRQQRVQFKAPASLKDIERLNSGIGASYSQIGKIITVYTRNFDEATFLAYELDRLTADLAGPTVPFDTRFKPGSIVYYRYGAYQKLDLELANGCRVPAVKDLEGNLVPDVRQSSSESNGKQLRARASIQDRSFEIIKAISQRGKGGVYQVLDLDFTPPRLCLLKEGRALGELDWDGIDGKLRVLREESVMKALRAKGLDLPRVYSSFQESGNYYLLTEFVEGENLNGVLLAQRRRFSVVRSLTLALSLAEFIASLHHVGWVWRDCKPSNLILTTGNGLRPVDFEGACPIGQQNPPRWLTPAYSLKKTIAAPAGTDEDLHALGVIIYLLLTGQLPDVPHRLPVKSLRKNVPQRLLDLLATLLNERVSRLIDSDVVARELRLILKDLRSQD